MNSLMGSFDITNCNYTHNTAAGGCGGVMGTSGETFITHNTAAEDGGVMYIDGGAFSITST